MIPWTVPDTSTKLQVVSVFNTSTGGPLGSGWVKRLKVVPGPDLMFTSAEVTKFSSFSSLLPIALDLRPLIGNAGPGSDFRMGAISS